MTSRKPDYILKAMNKDTGEKSNRIGAAWLNDDESISIQLDLCVTLDARDKHIGLMLFPALVETTSKARRRK